MAAAAPGSSWWDKLVTGVTGKAPDKGGTGALFSDVGNLAQGVFRWNAQNQLRDPNYLLNQAKALNQGNPRLKGQLSRLAMATMGDRGLAGAPGLVSEAVADSWAKIKYDQQQANLRNILLANQLALGEYPGYGGMPGGYGGYPGQDSSGAATT